MNSNPIKSPGQKNRLRAASSLLFFLLFSLLLLPALTQAADFCRTDGRWVRDPQGRTLILRGLNMSQSCKSAEYNFLPWQTQEEVNVIRDWGFNCVRYLIPWEAVEPEPGIYDEAYLDEVAKRLDWCRQAGIWVIIDMHQDVYGRKCGGNGAAKWACLDDGIPFVSMGGHWAMNYGSAAAIRTFDNFWANKEGPGGVGIQDRYAQCWQHIAERFKDDPNVVGYDLMNEPFYGSGILGIILSMARAIQTEMPGEKIGIATVSGGEGEGGDPIAKIMGTLAEKGALYDMYDKASYPGQVFEVKHLQPFHDRVSQAIREVDPHHIIVFESAGGAMSGTRLRSAISTPRDEKGEDLPNCIFAPHHYEAASEFGTPYDPESGLVSQALSRTEEARSRMGIPIWYGEWGAWDLSVPGIEDAVREHLDTFDKDLCGWAWWEYGQGFKDFGLLPLLTRPYAQTIAGTPERMSSTEELFELTFQPLPQGGQTIIWIPNKYEATPTITPADANIVSKRSPNGQVTITCPPGTPPCKITIPLQL